MAANQREDNLIETIHDLKAVLDECLINIERSTSDSDGHLIDKTENELHELNLKTNKIYTEMMVRSLEAKETKEVIESKKANT